MPVKRLRCISLGYAVFLFAVPVSGEGTRQAEQPLGRSCAACLEPMAGVYAIGVAAQKNVEAKVLHTSTIQKVAAPSEGNRLCVML